MGVGVLMERFKVLKVFILLLGSIAVIYIVVGLVKKSPKIQTKKTIDINISFISIIWTCFAVIWLNPQAIIS